MISQIATWALQEGLELLGLLRGCRRRLERLKALRRHHHTRPSTTRDRGSLTNIFNRRRTALCDRSTRAPGLDRGKHLVLRPVGILRVDLVFQLAVGCSTRLRLSFSLHSLAPLAS